MIRRWLFLFTLTLTCGFAVAEESVAQVRSVPPPGGAFANTSRDARTSLDFELAPQIRYFPQTGFQGQDRTQLSVSFTPEYQREWGRQSLRFVPFVRLDSMDDERTHGDLRELFWSYVADLWELDVGVLKVFWGVTEFKHVVDIINQTDRVENIDDEDKLGQPMVHLSLVRDFGIFDVFVLTGFRERTFPGTDGRLRLPLVVDDRETEYESGAGRARTDAAVRWSHLVGPLEFGVAHFHGTSREPRFFETTRPNGERVLAPFYDVIDQTSIDAQAIFGQWAGKLELYSRSGQGERFTAAAFGFERTFVGVFDSRVDLGLVAEYLFDGRGDDALTILENDIALGLRVALNDPSDTNALFGWIIDRKTGEYILSLEGSRRLGTRWQANLEVRVFQGAHSTSVLNSGFDPDNKSAFLQADDYVQLEIVRFF